MSSEEKDRESGKTSTAVAPPAPLVAEISQNTNNEDQDEGGPTNDQADLMEFFQNLAQEMAPLQQQQQSPPPEELAAASAAATESQKQQQKQQQHGHRSRGRRQGIKRSYISTDDHLDTLIGGSITSAAAASAVVEPTIDNNNINDGPMMMIQEHPGSPQKTHSSITPTPVHRTLANIEEQMVTIRNKLEKRSPKVTTAQLNQKLDRIINILRINGISE